MSPIFQTTIDRFTRRLATTHKETTVKVHLQAISSFLRFIDRRFPEVSSFAQLKRLPHVEEWLIELVDRRPKYAAATRETFVRALTGFFRRIVEWQFEDVPREKLISYRDAPKLEKLLPRALLPEDDRALLRALKSDPSIAAAALLITRNAGLRIGETVNLAHDCLTKQIGGAVIRVPLGKLNSERAVPVDEETAHLVERLRAAGDERRRLRRSRWEKPIPKTLILGPRDQEMGRHILRKTLAVIARIAGIEERVWPHRLRHTFAVSMIAGGMSLPALMKILGHNNVRMTMRYVQLTDADVAAQFQKAARTQAQDYAAARRSRPITKDLAPGHSRVALLALIDELEVRLAALHVESTEPTDRKRLLRLLQRLRRLQSDLNAVLDHRTESA